MLPNATSAQLTEWAVIERGVHEFDKQEIDGYKEDVDTLLVFAGLFSAVLTAFVNVSYGQLQNDTSGASLASLNQISLQTAGYVFEGGFLNTTAPAAAPTPAFQPTDNAIRLNVL
ncbi:hypothetical protein BDW22DRAFT_1339437 [Trametopsis cervina]|nr:hypothetical protein BDW22DRAFT_1339437 [Trametopsis cervina]